MTKSPKVLIIGAGVVGASIAWRLARHGARVTVLEAADTTGGTASASSFGWINAATGLSEPHFRLRFRAMEEWRRLSEEVADLPVSWCGGLKWDVAREEIDSFISKHTGWGYPLRAISSQEARELEPNLKTPPENGIYAAQEGAAEGGEVARLLLRCAAGLGATVVTNSRASSLRMAANKVIGAITDSGDVIADETVIAAGAGSPKLVESAGLTLPLTASPGMLIVSRPVQKLINKVVMSPALYVRQSASGRIIASVDFDSSDSRSPVELADEVLDELRAEILGAESLTLESYAVVQRPDTADGFPAIGRLKDIQGVYLATMHSGVTLAPAVGKFVADEILHDRRDVLLSSFGPERFARKHAHR
jgi:glycine/D-amino acid oxidase-like deaminating enzyme